MTAPQAILFALLACAAGALLCSALANHRQLAGWLALISTAITSGLLLLTVAVVLNRGPEPALTFLTLPGFGFAWRIYVDGLSALFLALIALVAPAAALYSIPYLDHYREYSVRRYYPNFLLFLAGMIGLVTTTDAMFFFFVFWQVMTLSSFLLIRFEHREPQNVRAANRYLLMMQLACSATMLGTELLARGAVTIGNETLMKYDFDALSHHLPAVLAAQPLLVALAFALFLIGFGIKAGLWPFGQMWLPEAHPAAPSPVSAMLSGVMIKTGVYGLLRYFLWLVPVEVRHQYPAGQWGALIAALGTVTLFVGTVQALREGQSKRILACSSIGQVGYILLGLGACLALINTPLTALATLGLIAALFHTLNHGLIKSLLFLNAGSILYTTGTQDLSRIGGLMRYMPVTAVTAAVGAFAIAGVPLSNAFASKWSLYVAAIHGVEGARYLPVCAVIAVLTSALTLAVFIRFFGAAYLSRSSAVVREHARATGTLEVPWRMRLPKIYLATACVVSGLAPILGYRFVGACLGRSRQGLGVLLADSSAFSTSGVSGLAIANQTALVMPLATLAVLATMYLLARALARAASAPQRAAVPWMCGYAGETDQTRYHAHNFYAEVKRLLRWAGGASPRRAPGPGSTRRAPTAREILAVVEPEPD